MVGINLDEILGEETPKPLTYRGHTFELPGELPADILAPLLSDDLGLIAILGDVFKEADVIDVADAADAKGDIIDALFDALGDRPKLPLEILGALKESLTLLLGDSAEEFYALKPSIPAYVVLAREIVRVYVGSLLAFFASSTSPQSDGETSSSTSSESSDSTPEASGADPETPGSSASDASSA